jgi:hypothetical protein
MNLSEQAWMQFPFVQFLFIVLLVAERMADQPVLMVETRGIEVACLHHPLVKPDISVLDLRFAVVYRNMACFGTRTCQAHNCGNPRRSFYETTHGACDTQNSWFVIIGPY